MFADMPDPRKDTHMTPLPLDGPMPRREPDEPQQPAPGDRVRSPRRQPA